MMTYHFLPLKAIYVQCVSNECKIQVSRHILIIGRDRNLSLVSLDLNELLSNKRCAKMTLALTFTRYTAVS